ncbi:MAG: DUF1501 domain-containing protein [Planctomycetaceae bacterium]|nr:DUF1501 domain-containing protein [Planctomycetaceae bacterium]
MFRFINPYRQTKGLPRRDFLRVGGYGLGSLALGNFLPGVAKGSPVMSPLRDKSVIFLFMHGGPSQFETFDPKMDAPTGIRSATGEIPTTIPGITFGSTFEKLAQRADKFNIVRSFVTGDGNHDIKPVMSNDTLQANLGSIYSRVAGPQRTDSAMPTNVALFPRAVEAEAGPTITDFGNFESAGEFGSAFAPFVPGAGAGLQQDMQLNLPHARLDDRRKLLAELDVWKRLVQSDKAVSNASTLQQLGFDALVNGISEAFDLQQEPISVLNSYDTRPHFNPNRIDKKWNNHRHYADHGTSIGKLLLLARRLCERGCGFVTITTSFVWDMHADINNAPMTDGMNYVGAPFDHAVAAFIDDIEARGLRDKILLVCCGEMGRTPIINKEGGRDHWGNLAPLLLYGGGWKSGQVIGQSARDGGQPASNPVTIHDLLATIMHTLFDVDQVRVTDGLPRNLLNVVGRGTPIPGL